ncbi:short chain dehydrogenase/reductase [Haloferula helveola]|uniref:Short chain dehydrogenase/reductase n=1 Tax=Haloferula helveola TaxID=490095 RepID=A0ABN6H422_9BACT|nr:short chain dehydrogenase/reductase [Haloferula helveola]
MNTIENKSVLITGANRGIGKAIAEVFLKRGAAKVYAAVRDVGSAQSLVDEFGERVQPVALDLSDAASIEQAARVASDVDIVVNNGGVLKTAKVLESGAFEAFAFEIDVNVYGLMRVAQAFAPVLAANGGGAFVQLNSVASFKNFPDFGTYSASKAAAYSVTQSLKDLLAAQNTQVISVHPGPIATDMGDAAGLSEIAEPAELVPEAILEALESGAFHAYPDSMAKQVGAAYASFAENVIEAEMSVG